MSWEGMEHRPKFGIECVESPQGSVAFSLDRGGIITSLILAETELLYLDQGTFKDPSKNVRGGIPLLFPQAGPVDDPRYPGLKQHGLARLSSSWVRDASVAGTFSESLTMPQPLAEYPYAFAYRVGGAFEADGSFTLSQVAENLSPDHDMPISMGLHPYFRVDAKARGDIHFDFPGGDIAEERADIWMNDGTVSIDNPGSDMRVVLPEVGTLVLRASDLYKKIWIWSKPDSPFICIEPVMRDEGGILTDPELVPPSSKVAAFLRIRLEK